MLRATVAAKIGMASLLVLVTLIAAAFGYSQGVSAQQPLFPIQPPAFREGPPEPVVVTGDRLGFMLDPYQEGNTSSLRGRFVIRGSDGRWVPVRLSGQLIPVQPD